MEKNYPKKGQLFKAKHDFICLCRDHNDKWIYKDSVVMLVDINKSQHTQQLNLVRFVFLFEDQICRTEVLPYSAWYQRFDYLNVNQS